MKTRYQAAFIPQAIDPGNEGKGRHRRCIRFGPPALLMEPYVLFENGASVFYGTDSRWNSSTSPIAYNDLWRGENRNRHLDPEGWSVSEFDESRWSHAVEIKSPAVPLALDGITPIES